MNTPWVAPRITAHAAERLERNDVYDIITQGTPLPQELVQTITVRRQATRSGDTSVYILSPNYDGILVLVTGIAVTFLRLGPMQQRVLHEFLDTTPAILQVTPPMTKQSGGIRTLRESVRDLVFDATGARVVHFDPPIGEVPEEERKRVLEGIIAALKEPQATTPIYTTFDGRGVTATIHWRAQ